MNLAWRKQARCRGVDPAVFYPVSDEDDAPEAKEIFLGQICPGLEFDTIEDWVRIYSAAGIGDHVAGGAMLL